VPLVFTGFLDVFAAKGGALDVTTQPEMLVDALATFGGRANTLHPGLERYLPAHENPGTTSHTTVSAPQGDGAVDDPLSRARSPRHGRPKEPRP